MTMTTPTTKSSRSDVSIILPGWSVTLVGPRQYPRCASTVKDGRPWVATDKAAKHHRNTTGTGSTPKFSQHGGGATVERDRAMCFHVVRVWLLSSQCGNAAETVAKDERTAEEPETLKYQYSDPGTDC